MEIQIDNDTDEEIAQAIATAVSEHLGRGVELVDEGETLAEAGENWSEEGAVVTEREEAVREQLEGILAGGPGRTPSRGPLSSRSRARDRRRGCPPVARGRPPPAP